MIDVLATRQAYDLHEILARFEYNLADCMTKVLVPHKLMKVMSTGKLIHPIKQWIIRRKNDQLIPLDKGGSVLSN